MHIFLRRSSLKRCSRRWLLDDTEHEDSLDYSEIEITDLEMLRKSRLASTLWQYSQRHRLWVRAFKAIFMCLGVFILAIAVLPPWLAHFTRHLTPATSAHATSSVTKSAACIESSSIVVVITSSNQSTGGTINVTSANGGTMTGSTSGNYQNGYCGQLNRAGTNPGGNGVPRHHDVRVRIVHQLSGAGIQWYSVR